MKVGVIGCGRVAEMHLKFIDSINNTKIVGLADVNMANAERLGKMYGVKNICSSIEELLKSTDMDILHITTPPFYHHAQAVKAIDHGINLLIEKPIALRIQDVIDLYERASSKGVIICPDYTQLFHPCWLSAKDIIESGQLGRLLYCEAHTSLDLNFPELTEAKIPHWSYDLPGGVLHNYLTHPLYLVLYWLGNPKKIAINQHSYGSLSQEIIDDVVLTIDSDRMSGRASLSAAMRPEMYYARLCCEKGIVFVRFDTNTILIESQNGLPRSVNRVFTNFKQAYHLSSGMVRNIINFMRKRLVPYQGLRTLVEDFYDAVENKKPPPISRDLAISVTKAESFFVKNVEKAHLQDRPKLSTQSGVSRPERILLTGATGYLGSEVARQLVNAGYYVRAFVRKVSKTQNLEKLGTDIYYGDIRDYKSFCSAAKEMDIIIHIAAGLKGTKPFIIETCVEGTKNVAKVALEKKISRVVYISSMSIYDYFGIKNKSVITEETPLEKLPEFRGVSSLAKRKAEDVALSHLKKDSSVWTILRPSIIFGNGRNILTLVGSKIGNFLICPGRRNKHIKLIHVKDVSAAIIKVIQTDQTRGRIYNLSHPGKIKLSEYVKNCIRKSDYKNINVIYFPYWTAYLAMLALRVLHRIRRKGPTISLKQLAYQYRDLVADSHLITKDTKWHPQKSILEQLSIECKFQAD
jgi:predicted dehydrogenase/nucleoside-diphosphate-sugar epimerase